VTKFDMTNAELIATLRNEGENLISSRNADMVAQLCLTMSLRAIALAIGKDRGTVRRLIEISRADAATKALIDSGALSVNQLVKKRRSRSADRDRLARYACIEGDFTGDLGIAVLEITAKLFPPLANEGVCSVLNECMNQLGKYKSNVPPIDPMSVSGYLAHWEEFSRGLSSRPMGELEYVARYCRFYPTLGTWLLRVAPFDRAYRALQIAAGGYVARARSLKTR
jgi:hypothetical protein